MGDRSEEGRRGEAAAARHLIRRGWTILARRWRGAGGELDLVAARGDVVAICEVKARGDPAVLEEPVTAAQRERIGRAAAAFLASRPDLEGRTVRLDLIAVRTSRLRARVTHRAGAIEGRERPPSRQGHAQNTG
jgi:putative endonuclease